MKHYSKFKFFLSILFICFGFGLFGQTNPDTQPEILDPAGSDKVYTQTRGALKSLRLDTLKNQYMSLTYNSTALSYNPDTMSVVPDSLRAAFWIGADGNGYYVDGDKNVLKFFTSGAGGSGDMTKAVYDPTNVNDNAFDMDNMVEGTNKILTAAERTKLSGIETAATADQSDSEIETAYNNQVSVVSQVDAEAGTSTTVYRWTPERVAQAIAALGGSGTDDQVIDTLELSGTTLRISLEGDGEPVQTVDLSSLQDGTGTDSQTLSFVNPNLSITGGNSVDISGIDTDTQLSEAQVDSYVSNNGYLTSETDDQTIDTFSIVSNTLRLSLEDDGEVFNSVDLSPYLDNTDTQLTQEQVEDYAGALIVAGSHSLITTTYSDPGNNVQLDVESDLSLYDNGTSGFLTSEVDGSTTNELQTVDTLSLTGTTLTLALENDGESPYTVDLATLQDGTGTDDQTIDVLDMSSGSLQLSLEDDGQATQTVSLISTDGGNTINAGSDGKLYSAAGSGESTTVSDGNTIDLTLTGSDIDGEVIIDPAGTNILSASVAGLLATEVDGSTDNELQTVDTLSLSGTTLTLALESDGEAPYTVDLASLQDGTGTDDQTIDVFSFDGTSISLSLEDDGQATQTLDISSVDTDTQLSQKQVEDFAGGMVTGNTETLITVTYQDADGTVDYVVDNNLANYDNATSGFLNEVGVGDLDADVTSMFGIVDGMAFDKPSFTVVDATGLKLDIEKIGGGDMRFLIDGTIATLDCTTGAGAGGKARVALTEGTDVNNQATNYIYVTQSGGTATLNASTTMPTGAFGWVGKIVVPDATTWASNDETLIQRYTEAFSNDSRGALSHAREKLRALGAVYISGGTHTTNIAANGAGPDTVHLQVASAVIYQLHRQSFPAINTGPYYYGNGLGVFEQLEDLSDALILDDSTAITNNQRFNLIIWGAVNYSTGDCKLFVNLSSGVYSSDEQAQSDVNNYADYSVPNDFRSVAFLISRVALKYNSGSGGTWTELGTYSLLGVPPGVRGGGSAAVASNEFDDSQLRIFDNADATKQLAFEVSGVTTSTTRTLTVPDASGTIALTSDLSDDQTVDTLSLSGTTLTLALENDGESPYTVDLSSLQDGTGTDDQQVDTLRLVGTSLELSLESDGEAAQTVDLSSLQDGTGTDDQTIDVSSFDGTDISLSLESDGEATKTIDISSVVTTARVTSAGALMDSEVDADIQTLDLPANTTITTFGESLIDDATAAAARTTLDVDQAGTDNSTDVTLTGTPDYLTLSIQEITLNQIDLTTDVTGVLPSGNIGSHNHTASDVTDFDTEVSNNTSVATNTAKVSNATHTGEVAGSTALTIQSAAIMNRTQTAIADGDQVLLADVSNANALIRASVSDFYDGTGTDDQTIDGLSFDGTNISISLEDDGEAAQTVDISSVDTDTDDQGIDVLSFDGTSISISLDDDGEATQTLDISSVDTDTDTGLYVGDGTAPADVDVTVTDSINFDAGTLFIAGNTDRIGIRNDNPQEALDVTGAVLISARTGTATSIGGYASNGKAVDVTLGSNLTLSGGELSATDTDTQLSEEEVEDFVGGMVTGNTETLITVTYQDGDGTLDFVVDNDLSNYDNGTSGFLTAETDGSITNEGSLTVGAGTSTTSIINSNTSGSTGVTITAGTGLSISEVSNTITLTNTETDTDDQTIDALSFNGTSISISLEDDGEANQTVDISSVVTTGRVTSAGALMDSEVDADIQTLSLPANTTITTFGESLIDDSNAAAARTTLGVDAAGTDNSTDVTLSGTPDYITIAGQVITRGLINLSTDITGTLDESNIDADIARDSETFQYENNSGSVSSGNVDLDWNSADGGFAVVDLSVTGTTFNFDMQEGVEGGIYTVRFTNYSSTPSITTGSNIFNSVGTTVSVLPVKGNYIYRFSSDGTNFYLAN